MLFLLHLHHHAEAHRVSLVLMTREDIKWRQNSRRSADPFVVAARTAVRIGPSTPEATGARIDPARSRPPSQRTAVILQNAQVTQYMRLSPLTAPSVDYPVCLDTQGESWYGSLKVPDSNRGRCCVKASFLVGWINFALHGSSIVVCGTRNNKRLTRRLRKTKIIDYGVSQSSTCKSGTW